MSFRRDRRRLEQLFPVVKSPRAAEKRATSAISGHGMHLAKKLFCVAGNEPLTGTVAGVAAGQSSGATRKGHKS
ncbi:hypothetical protein [Bradyrhizobium sp.]|uniref:hypothetical protein n=1 Tax=Bradyrhizobium sp. TaxID=376 RepID=UPI003C395279